jgi:hypothetical protein
MPPPFLDSIWPIVNRMRTLFNKNLELELLTLKTTHKAALLAQEYIQRFLKRYNRKGDEDARSHWDGFLRDPERLASHSGTRVAIIIDEFQDMKSYIYDYEISQEPINLPATYDRQAQSRKAPMLVSGSAVTLIFKTVMGGALGGRFDFRYLKPMSIPDGATLLLNTLKYYAPDKTTPELALYASTQVGGHPYYLYCLATSQCERQNFVNQKAIDRVIRYEIENGKIFGFWQTHFQITVHYSMLMMMRVG